METIIKHLLIDSPDGLIKPYNDLRNETLGGLVHYFSAINSLKPDKWADWRTCWELFHDLNLELQDRKYAVYDGKKYSVSVNNLIDRLGLNIELAPMEARTWHAGRSIMNGRQKCNNFTIGYELIAAPYMAKEKNGQYNKELLEIYGFTESQYQTVAELIHEAIKVWGFGLNWIQGHDTVRRAWNLAAPKSKRAAKKSDPGVTFDMDKLHAIIVKRIERFNSKNETDLDGG